MKILLITVFLATIVFGTHAQISKGNYLVAGSLSYEYEKDNTEYPGVAGDPTIKVEYKSSVLSLSPKAGVFLSNRVCAGISLPITIRKSWSSSEEWYNKSESTSRSFGAGPFVRYYIPMSQKWFVFPEVSAIWAATRVRSSGYHIDPVSGTVMEYASKDTYNNATFAGGVGVTYVLNANVGIELFGGYRTNTNDDHAIDDSIAVSVGLQVYLSQ